MVLVGTFHVKHCEEETITQETAVCEGVFSLWPVIFFHVV